jgi:hypothetical protein
MTLEDSRSPHVMLSRLPPAERMDKRCEQLLGVDWRDQIEQVRTYGWDDVRGRG